MTLRTALAAATSNPLVVHWPWPYAMLEYFVGLRPKSPHVRCETVRLAATTAKLVHAPGVSSHADRAVLYLHGGGFLICGPNTHYALIARLSKAADAPVLVPNYRKIPHSLDDAISDCLAGYWWLRCHYRADQIVLAGDSAGGYLAMAVAMRLARRGEYPAAMALMSPLLQLDPKGKQAHPNMASDAMFTGYTFDALLALLNRANDGVLYEPLEDCGDVCLPPTLIHVSGDEVLLHDALLAEERLSGSVEVVIWPGQIHVFQIAGKYVPEAKRSIDQLGEFIIEKTSLKPAEDRTSTVG